MRGLGQWQSTQLTRLVVAAGATVTHTFTVDQSAHAIMSLRIAKYATTTDTSPVLPASSQIRLTIENEQVFSGEFCNIQSVMSPVGGDGLAGVGAWELVLARPVQVAKDYAYKISCKNVHGSTTFDYDVALFGLVASE